MSSSLVVRPYREGDEAGIDELLRTCFPRYRGPEFWEWIHKRNPLGFHGQEGDIWVAEMEGKIVGCYGRIRYRIWYFGQLVFAVQGIQIATHPSMRRQGIALKILSSAWANSKNQNVKLSFGYPNNESYLAVKKFTSVGQRRSGFVDLELVERLQILDRRRYFRSRYKKLSSRILGSVAVLPSYRPLRETHAEFLEGVNIVNEFMEDAGSVFSSIKKMVDIGIERSTEYLRWRYNASWGQYMILCAVRENETLGYAVQKIEEKRRAAGLLLCEFLARNDEEKIYAFLLNEVQKIARDAKAAYIAVSSSSSLDVLLLSRRAVLLLLAQF